MSVYQYNETNVMHFSFNLLRIKDLYMFRALLTHPQEALHKRHLIHGCSFTATVQLTLYARNVPNAVCVAPSEDKLENVEAFDSQ
jgi:hypothetical protein